MGFPSVPVPDLPLALSSASLSRSIYYSSAHGLPSLLGFWELTFLLSPLVNWWESSLQLPGGESRVSLCSLCSSLFLSLHPHFFLLSFPSLLVSAVPGGGGGGGGAAAVAGSKAVPALPEGGQSEAEPPEVEGGAKATGNEPLLGARDDHAECGAQRAEPGPGPQTGTGLVPPPCRELPRCLAEQEGEPLCCHAGGKPGPVPSVLTREPDGEPLLAHTSHYSSVTEDIGLHALHATVPWRPPMPTARAGTLCVLSPAA